MLNCDNCGKEIPTDSFELHSLHCARNIVKCECGQALLRSLYTAHLETEHAEIKCQHCDYRAPKYAYQHECLVGPVICQFCEASLPQSHYHDHIYNCGSRTESCPKCLKYIPLRDYRFHTEEIDCIKPLAGDEVDQDELLARQLQEDIYRGRQESIETQSPHEFQEYQGSSLADPIDQAESEDEPEQLGQCPICSQSVPVSLLPRHTSECLESSPYDTDEQEINEAILKSLQER